MDGSVLEEKSLFKMVGLIFSKLDWGCYIISIDKTASKKIGALICSICSPRSSSHRIVKTFQDLLLKILQTLAYTVCCLMVNLFGTAKMG